MRYLSRIILIQSAHVPYAEINLDGNVHFIGTQGVGKTTLLRAILFFYNADKLKLGIQKEKKPFDAFYFEYPNSYIIYEVMRENGPFFIVAFKYQGRVAFRFVDTGYRKEYFVNSIGEVYSDWSAIKNAIGKDVYCSGIVDIYENYRDIIYGNRRAVKPQMYRFALSESSNYQNIPRTIQNVFMNSKLDADEIKRTIISSLDDDEAFVDLTYYRSQVASFEQQFKDISVWYKKDARGQVEIRNLADKVNAKYRDLLALGASIRETCSQLRYAFRRDSEALPEILHSLTEHSEEYNRQMRLISEEEGKHNKQQQELNREIGALDGKLKEIKKLRARYESIEIQKIIQLVESEEGLKAQVEGYRSEKDILSKTSEDISLRYKLLLDQLRLTYKEQINVVSLRKNTLKADHDKAIVAAQEHQVRAKDSVLVQYEADLSAVKEALLSINLEQERLKARLDSIVKSRPLQDKVDEIRELIRNQEQLSAAKNQEKVHIKFVEETLIKDCEKELEKLESEYQAKIRVLKSESEHLQKQVDHYNDLLKKSDGSLYQWLEDNMPHWKDNIGMIADEESILYNTGLSPKKSKDGGSSFYGVSLDLSSVQREILSPSDCMTKVSELKAKIDALRNEERRLYEENESDRSAVQKKYNLKLRSEKDKLHDVEVILSSIPTSVKNLNVRLSDALAEESIVKDREKATVLAQLDASQAQLSGMLQQEKNLQEQKSAKLTRLEKELRNRVKEIQDVYDEQLSELTATENKLEKEYGAKAEEIALRQQGELKGNGVDIEAFDEISRRISSLETVLRRINDSRKDYYAYQTHKAELFDREPEMKQNKSNLETKLRDLEGKFAMRHQQLKARATIISDRIGDLKSQQTIIQEGISEYNKFIADQHFCPMEMGLAGELKTNDPLMDVLNRIRGLIIDRRDQKDVFRTCVNKFKGHFSAQNTFNFKTHLESEEDYMEFARELCDFIDNAKIEEYKTRISDRYGEILQRVAKEIGYLMEHSHQIEKVIADINADFRDKNFTGVIKKIALRSRQSNDHLMQLFLRIYRFVEEYGFSIGEYNLFSNDKDATTEAIIENLFAFAKVLTQNDKIKVLSLSDTFRLEFQIIENDNDTGWVEKIANVGSDGTDILVKAMINIMLLNVFKTKISRKFGDFSLHCMMDEIGKLHPTNVKGILEFANMRNIRLINSSPMTYNVSEYKYTYLMSKDSNSYTSVVPLIARI